MNILIAFFGKTGTSERASRMLADALPGHNVTLLNWRKNALPSLDSFDTVVLGGSVRFGRIPKVLRRMPKETVNALSDKRLGLFLCCGYIDSFEEYVGQFPAALRENAVSVSCFGGELKPQNAKGLDRFLIRSMRESIKNGEDHNEGEYDRVLPEIVPENITRMAEILRGVRT